jgi:radical SAM superfamily enzyme YgiQ (UPF0313 family)
MGGFHPTLFPDEAARHCDAVCVGDAENKMPQIIADFENGRLQQFYNGGQPDLASIPRPDRGLLSNKGIISIDTILATRGCPHKCTFCSVTHFHNHTYRKRPVEDVADELAGLRRWSMFVDDNLLVDRSYAMDLFEAIAPLNKRWFSQCSTTVAEDPELLGKMAASGCRGLFVGFESLSTENLSAWKKRFNRPELYKRSIAKLHEFGIAVFAGIVLGMDDDGPDVFRKTLHFLDESGLDFVAINVLTPFPGTPLYDEMHGDGRIFDYDWSKYDFNQVVFEPRNMSAEHLRRGARWVRANFYSRERVARRVRKSFSYLDPATIFRTVIPMNLGFRARMATSGTLEEGFAYEPE